MVNGGPYVIVTSVLLMLMSFVEWRVILRLSVLRITQNLVEDIIVHYAYDWEAESNTLLVLCIYIFTYRPYLVV